MRIAALLVVTLLSGPLLAADRVTGAEYATRSEVMATQAMAATSQPLATQAALEIMRSGGNAVDAAIAANAVLGLVEPTGNGIGGDLYAMVWHGPSATLHGLNASGASPQGTPIMYISGAKIQPRIRWMESGSPKTCGKAPSPALTSQSSASAAISMVAMLRTICSPSAAPVAKASIVDSYSKSGSCARSVSPVV